MSSWMSSDAFGASVTLTPPEVQAGQTLFSSSSGFSVLEFIGEGCFGKVAKCLNLATKETVAVKILKQDSDFIRDTEKEVSILKVISVLNPDHTNVVKFFERFEHMGQTCLAFEMLDKNLYDLLQERDWKPLSLNEIRPIAKQLLVALDALKGLGILHTDIKPDNVMFVNNQDQPLRVKLIDFGGAIPASKIQPGLELQPTGYRAPEVALGFPFTEAIDMWGVGCILAFLYIAQNLFPVDCDYQMMKCMVELLGQPEDHLLRAGLYTQYFFIEEEAADGPTWRLMTPEEYTAANNMKPAEWNSFTELPSSLDDLVNIYPEGEAAEFEDRRAFVDNLKGLLHLDGDQRITPCQALQYSFITMSHLTEHLDSRAYLTTSLIMMEGSADRVHTSAAKSHFRGRPSGSKNDAAATRSFYRTKATSYYKDPASWFTDGVPVTSSYYKDPASWFTDGVRGTSSYYKDPASWYTDGVQGTSSYYKDPASWFTDGVPVTSSCDEDPASWFTDGGSVTSSYYKDPASWFTDGGSVTSSYYKDPASSFTDGVSVTSSYYKDPASSFTDGVSVTSSYYKDPASWFTDGVPVTSSCDEDPASWFTDGGSVTSSYYKDPASSFTDGVPVTSSCDEDPASLFTDGVSVTSSNDEDPTSWSSDGEKPTDSTAAASSSSGHIQKLLERIHRFFSRVSAAFCCWRSAVED